MGVAAIGSSGCRGVAGREGKRGSREVGVIPKSRDRGCGCSESWWV